VAQPQIGLLTEWPRNQVKYLSQQQRFKFINVNSPIDWRPVVERKLTLAVVLGVTEFVTIIVVNRPHFILLLVSELNVQQNSLRGLPFVQAPHR
jgi:hypothetical protein